MIKWIIIGLVALVVTVFVIKFIKMMLRVETDSNNSSKPATNQAKDNSTEYVPEAPVNIHSSSAGISMADLQEDTSSGLDYTPAQDFDTMFKDTVDEDFNDFSNFAHNSKGRRRRPPVDFDLEGDFADEYIPSSPDFSYLPRRRPEQPKTTVENLHEMPTELKVLMLSDIFDRKF